MTMAKIPANIKRRINRELANLNGNVTDNELSVLGDNIQAILTKNGYTIPEGHMPYLTGETGQTAVQISPVNDCELVDNASLSLSWYKRQNCSNKVWDIVIYLS